jgi:hypothetical protein
MNPPIGFVLLVNPFNPLEQSARLIWKLNRMFDHPPIACHHDFGKNPNFISDCPKNVQMVHPHVNTKWADFSCIEAAISALRLLYTGANAPDWFIYLSSADYPIKPAARIIQDLQTSPFDAYIEHRLVQYKHYAYNADPSHPESYKGADWLKHCHKLYCSFRVTIPSLTRYFTPRTRTYWLDHPLITAGRLPFSDSFRCCAGEAWFCTNRKSALALLKFYDEDRAVAAHYRRVLVPEESYFQTVLANSPSLKLSQNTLRYADWTAGGSHPKILKMEDLPRMAVSNAHFARKFDETTDAKVLDELDAIT